METSNKANKVPLHYVAKETEKQSYVVYLRQICQTNGKDLIKGIFPYEKGTTAQAAKNASNFCAKLNKELPTKVSPNFAVHSRLDSWLLLNEYVSHLVHEKVHFTFVYGFADLENNGKDVDFCDINFQNKAFFSVVDYVESVQFTEKKVIAYVNMTKIGINGIERELCSIECANLSELINVTN